ncbi:SDR family oxidoreductase [Deinococcus roseus]|uniref:Short-chain dehydrogenase n=1 Tax=Deinococcus roseus TaxID=392414 RepID=A0ABQ2DDH7_9DEIO|nr:SDR family oxidoreductase [Deinococcus roseus]GGJ54388.1 short-chain dehydrogenase [Deinococcus roseus]
MQQHTQPVALVTGANTGIGHQIARDLVSHGFTVLVGARNPEKGKQAAQDIGPDAHPLHLDVTDQATIDAAAEHIRNTFGRLDVLVNNAGISQPDNAAEVFPATVQAGMMTVASPEYIRTVFETNVFGVIAVTQAMLPLLHEAPAGRIVNLGSGAGSLALNADPGNPGRAMFGTYSASKSALHAVTLALAVALESTPIKVNVACPGFTSTALNNFSGTRTVEQAAREAVRLALLGPDGPTGTFSNEDGPMPW